MRAVGFTTLSGQRRGRLCFSASAAARAIIDAVNGGTSTLRLPLGADAVAGMRDKLAQLGRDLDAWEAVAAATAL